MPEGEWATTELTTYRRGVKVADGVWLNPDQVGAVRVELVRSDRFDVVVYIGGEGLIVNHRTERDAANVEAERISRLLWGPDGPK